jgi:hypothetical protein
MLKKVYFGIFIACCLIGAGYWYSYVKKVKAPVSNAINAIPLDAALVFESKQSRNTWKKLSNTNIMWEELMSIAAFKRLSYQASYADSLLELGGPVNELLEGQSIFISVHPAEDSSFDLLYSYSLPNLTQEDQLTEFLRMVNDGKEPAEREYSGQTLYSLQPQKKQSMHYALINGTLMMSINEELVKRSVDQLNSKNTLASENRFGRVLQAAGKNVDANLYINYSYFPALFAGILQKPALQDLTSVSDFATCSGWDITVKPNALMLSGFTQANDTAANFLSIFSEQKPQEIVLTKVAPAKTTFMLFYGISNIEAYQLGYKKYLGARKQLKLYEDYCADVKQRYNIDIEKDLTSWINNEIAFILAEPTDSMPSGNPYAVIRANDIEEASRHLSDIADSVSSDKSADTSNFSGHTIRQLPLPSLLSNLLGWQFKNIRGNFFCALEDYIIFADSEQALKNFINDFENGKTLNKNKNYISFTENISGETNLYLYSTIARSSSLYKSFAQPQLHADFDRHLELFKKFEAMAIQFSAGKNLFYSNAYLKYNPEYKQENSTLWETRLDTTVSSKPYLVLNHKTHARDVLVQDDANKIYLISNKGKIIWTKQLNEKIMSDITQVDALKNDKLQMVFNTRSFIYMFDRNGNDMKGFPVKLRSPATNGITVFDYEKSRDYRIFIACENKRILCYNVEGAILGAFKSEPTRFNVFLPIQYLRTANKDHLVAVDAKGFVYILNRQGEIRVKTDDQLSQGMRAFFTEAGKDYKHSFIIGADTSGNVIKISFAGEKENIKMQDFETSPYFEYRDLDNDKTKEFIFLTRDQLKVFSQDRSLLFSHNFAEKIEQPPFFFLYPDGRAKIGVVSEKSNELFLFNNNGNLEDGFPLNGRTPFSIGDLNKERIFHLITGSSENSIYTYQLH